MVIIGDAAHADSPSSGQGASMAIEDAVVPARCLRDGASIEELFASYESLRRGRVEKIVAQGKTLGLLGPCARYHGGVMPPAAGAGGHANQELSGD
jgi:FAD-dependent urate hydroxylase